MPPKIRKLVIPVAGLGTRFLPATKAQPKEMLPVVDKPIIQYVVEDAVRAGITDIILVTGPSKRAVEDHFSPNYELVNWLKKQGKDAMAEDVKKIADLANFIFVRQKGPYGMPGHGFIPKINETLNSGEEALVEVVFEPAAHGPAGVGPIQRAIAIENNAGEPVELLFAAIVTP